ncbi:hypothetical protein BH10ACI2_BH10ACI2_00060 [soil metagenome]
MSNSEPTDFTAEDYGKFKHPDMIGGIPHEELEQRVLKAITDDAGAKDGRAFRTLPGITRHAGLDRAFDLTWVIEGMELDKKIRRRDSGNITAFFRYDQMPTRF